MSKPNGSAADAASKELKQHCLDVAKCRVADAVLTTALGSLAPTERQCAAIISAQLLAVAPDTAAKGSTVWLIPEPWNGHLETAKILFIGQNPSANSKEDYPARVGDALTRSDQSLFDFFQDRFERQTPGGIVDGRRVKHADGTPGRSNPFLSRVKKLATEILGPNTTPGRDYAITEAVRCKAANAIGVEFAVRTCAELHLSRTLELTRASVIVCMGAMARTAFRAATKCTDGELAKVFEWNGKKVVYIAHSNARASAKARELPASEVTALKEFLSTLTH